MDMNNKIQTLGGYIHEYQKSCLQHDEFWGRITETFHWKRSWDQVLEWNFEQPDVKWFKG